MKIVVQKRVSAANLTLQKILEEMKVHAPDYWEDFDGDYKDAAVVNEQLCEHAADCLGYKSEVMVDAYSCPRSWQVKITTPCGVTAMYPPR